MTNTQLYLAIGVPIIVNAIFNTMLIGLTWSHFNSRIDDVRDMLRSELRRMEEVFDARLKHLEEKLP
ncbi:MAG: hypothetical protein J2P56_07005 [Verrucomicrobia bacterium]|nr:hypothetical protein [Verrucomicrobiota bacterium]